MALDRKNPKNVPGVKDSGFSTPSLDRALAILKCLGGHPAGLTLSQIATELGLPVNFVYRVTQSLVAHQYLVRDSQKRFSMGVGLLGLCQPVCDDVPLTEAALPAMRWLSEQSGESAHLGILSGNEGIVLERVIGKAQIKFYTERGTRFPLHTSAPGKVILAFLPEAEREEVLREISFEQFHPWTIASREELLRCLQKVRADRYALDLSEHLEGLHCLGGPIFDAAGSPIASLWVTGTSQRINEARIEELIPIVRRACAMATEALGGREALE
ncbi:MAG: IclR family transcriptional regulator [Verrucomicrobiota bacterium]|jgi:DNA-binding IclR family transcriptional regulator